MLGVGSTRRQCSGSAQCAALPVARKGPRRPGRFHRAAATVYVRCRASCHWATDCPSRRPGDAQPGDGQSRPRRLSVGGSERQGCAALAPHHGILPRTSPRPISGGRASRQSSLAPEPTTTTPATQPEPVDPGRRNWKKASRSRCGSRLPGHNALLVGASSSRSRSRTSTRRPKQQCPRGYRSPDSILFWGSSFNDGTTQTARDAL
jgi:hypothetical protein